MSELNSRKPLGRMTIENMRQFVDVDPVSGCWNWKFYRLKSGYGRKEHCGKKVYTHRLAYTLANGPIPDGLEVRHSCDNPPCINPDHLSIGTRQQNVDDMVSRGRQAKAARLKQTILSSEQVKEIRLLLQDMSERKIAERYGVTRGCIRGIARGINWKHLV